jgi:hypothetical protein
MTFGLNCSSIVARCVLVFALIAAGIYSATAKERALSSQDLAVIKRICRRFVGFPVTSDQKLFEQLEPFLRSKSELERRVMDCSSQHCNGTVRLRDDTEVLYRFMHVPPERSKIGPGDLTPDIEYKGNNRFVAVAVVRHGKIVFSQGWLPEWFKDQHLHRYSKPRALNVASTCLK